MPEKRELPSLPKGFTARGATMEDAQAVTDLIVAHNVAAFGSPDVDLAEVEGDWRRPSMDIAEDEHLVFAPDGPLVAWAEVFFPQDAQALVLQEWRGRGIGAHLLCWTERRAEERAKEGSTETLIRQSVLDSDEAGRNLFTSSGYDPVWSSWDLELQLGDGVYRAPPPDGVTIREFRRGKDDRIVHRVIDDAFMEWSRREPEPFDDWREYTLERTGADPSLWFVAESGEEVVGAVITFFSPQDGDGWIQELAVAATHRRRGVGSALLSRSFTELALRGATKAALTTDSRGGARALYEGVGMKVIRSYTKFERELSI
ncbi:MAG: GNAT family N-acetyltransferase [Actinomycetota bacterium]|nr:GNAT family N-acetyltransferase [Actinomycetota bacterium]